MRYILLRIFPTMIVVNFNKEPKRTEGTYKKNKERNRKDAKATIDTSYKVVFFAIIYWLFAFLS